MIKLEFERLIERPISDEEFRKIQLVYMNTEAIVTPSQMSYIEEVGELKRELSDVKKENRRLREFQGMILKAYEEVEKDV